MQQTHIEEFLAERINIDSIIIKPNRQRTELPDLTELADSISRLGLINPITVTRGNVLVAGECRLTCCRQLGWKDIPVRYVDQLTDKELQMIELEENTRRSDLSWQDKTKAIATLYELHKETGVSNDEAAKRVGLQLQTVQRHIAVHSRMSNPKIAEAPTFAGASNIVRRAIERQRDNELNILTENIIKNRELSTPEPEKEAGMASVPELPAIPAASIENANFIDWLKTYEGDRFSFIHCDFPYGINHQNSEQGGADAENSYEDSEEVYWALVEALFTNLDKIAYPTAHIMFWFSMKHYTKTIARIYELCGDDVSINPTPMVWYKSDNKGIVSDVNRSPRNVMEFCLHISRGDRKIVSPKANCYAAPTAKHRAIHLSEKPVSMLKHFFSMYLDEYSEVLDPTCGGGSAIRAAVDMKAKRVLGLELNPQFAELAQQALKEENNKARLATMLGIGG
jgi:ParB/RepB/Spo0J family partition protein